MNKNIIVVELLKFNCYRIYPLNKESEFKIFKSSLRGRLLQNIYLDNLHEKYPYLNKNNELENHLLVPVYNEIDAIIQTYFPEQADYKKEFINRNDKLSYKQVPVPYKKLSLQLKKSLNLNWNPLRTIVTQIRQSRYTSFLFKKTSTQPVYMTFVDTVRAQNTEDFLRFSSQLMKHLPQNVLKNKTFMNSEVNFQYQTHPYKEGHVIIAMSVALMCKESAIKQQESNVIYLDEELKFFDDKSCNSDRLLYVHQWQEEVEKHVKDYDRNAGGLNKPSILAVDALNYTDMLFKNSKGE